MILGRSCGPSATSGMEAISIYFRCSIPPGYQVVRPRDPGCGRWTGLVAGAEPSSELLFDLGGDAWRSPATCGGGALGPDCFFIFSPRVVFVRMRGLIFKFQVLNASDVKGLFVKCNNHVYLQ
jgi:hypothetical protein